MKRDQERVKQIVELTGVARGDATPDLVLRGGQLINVYSGEIYVSDVAFYHGKIAALGNHLKFPGTYPEVDCREFFLCPGYVEPHAHPWLTYTPVTLSQTALACGTTTMVMDNLMFMLQAGKDNFLKFVNAMDAAPLNVYWAARPESQSPEEAEAKTFGLEILSGLLENGSVIATAEVTRWPALAGGDEELVGKLLAAHDCDKRCDGHTAGCKPLPLNAVIAAGVDACHESINASEAKERLRRGLWLMLRHSSLRPDLPEILPDLIQDGISLERVMLTTDGSSPVFISHQGFIDGMLRVAVEAGLEPVKALQLVTLHPAQFLNLDRELGGIAPGRRADVLLLSDLESFVPEVVYSAGQDVASSGKLKASFPALSWDELGFNVKWRHGNWLAEPEIYRAEVNEVLVPVIELRSCVITKRVDLKLELGQDGAMSDHILDVLCCSLVNRQGSWICNGFLKGFARDLDGLASTFNRALELLVVGRSYKAMAQAAAEVRRMGGGIAVVEGGEIVFRLQLPLGGLANEEELSANSEKIEQLQALLVKYGYEYHDPLYSLFFLACDFLPGIRLSPLGVLDIKSKQVLLPAKAIK